MLVRPPVAIRKRLRIGFDVKQAAGNFAPVVVVQPGRLGQDFRLAYGLSLRCLHHHCKPPAACEGLLCPTYYSMPATGRAM